MNPRNRNPCRKGPLRGFDGTRGAFEAQPFDGGNPDALLCGKVSRIRNHAACGKIRYALQSAVYAKEYRCASGCLADLSQKIVISVQENGRSRPHIVKDLGFGAEDTLPVLQKFQVAGSDVGDDHPPGTRDLRKRRHIPEMAHAHLQNRDLILFFQSEHRQRKAKLIVKIPFRFLCPEPDRQNRCDHLLGRGLPHRAGNPDHRNPEQIKIALRNRSKRCDGILNQDPCAHTRKSCVFPEHSLFVQ